MTKAKSTARRSTTSRKPATSTRKSAVTAAQSSELDTDEDVLHAEADAPAAVAVDDLIDADEQAALEAEDASDDEPVEVIELPIVPLPELKKKELVDLAVERSGVKKRDAKPAIEAALAVLGEALAEGREMNLVPLGKLKVTRMKKGGNGQIINLRVRQPEESEFSLTDPLAQAAE